MTSLFELSVREVLTGLERLQGQRPLSGCLGAVVLHHGEAQEAHLLKVHSELKVLAPHGVERVAVDGLRAEVAAVDRHAQDVDLDAGAAGAVAGANILARHDLGDRR